MLFGAWLNFSQKFGLILMKIKWEPFLNLSGEKR